MTSKSRIAVAVGASAVLIAAAAAPVAEGGRKFVKALTGQAELDGGRLSADMDGRGTAHVFVNVGQQRVCWNLVGLANLDPLVAAHIHEAPVDGQGSIRINFFTAPQEVDLEDCVSAEETPNPFDRARLVDIVENPQNYYVNIHTTEFTGGAIRGQLGRGKQG